MTLKTEFERYPNLASEEAGTEILFATDDFFAVAENLIKASEPTFNSNTYTPFGKEMDGWETRRKRIPGHDWCLIKLGYAGQIIGFDVDTAHFTGNYTPSISIQGCYSKNPLNLIRRSEMGSQATSLECEAAERLKSNLWTTILDISDLRAGIDSTRHNYFRIACREYFTHIRLNMFPDGGIARLRVYGNVIPDFSLLKSPCDLAVLCNGGKAISWSNSHYGTPMQLLKPSRSTGMHDGWETARNINRPKVFQLNSDGMLNFNGKEHCVIQLGRPCQILRIIIDTNHYKGNFPESCYLEWSKDSMVWNTLLPRSKLSPHCLIEFCDLEENDDASFVKLTMIPDGGISRLRVIGSW